MCSYLDHKIYVTVYHANKFAKNDNLNSYKEEKVHVQQQQQQQQQRQRQQQQQKQAKNKHMMGWKVAKLVPLISK